MLTHNACLDRTLKFSFPFLLPESKLKFSKTQKETCHSRVKHRLQCNSTYEEVNSAVATMHFSISSLLSKHKRFLMQKNFCAFIHSPQGCEPAFPSSMHIDSNSKSAELLLTACLLSQFLMSHRENI